MRCDFVFVVASSETSTVRLHGAECDLGNATLVVVTAQFSSCSRFACVLSHWAGYVNTSCLSAFAPSFVIQMRSGDLNVVEKRVKILVQRSVRL